MILQEFRQDPGFLLDLTTDRIESAVALGTQSFRVVLHRCAERTVQYEMFESSQNEVGITGSGGRY